MLFSYLSHLLQGEINEQNILMSLFNNYNDFNHNHSQGGGKRRKAFSTREMRHLFGGTLDRFIAIHDTNLSHWDVKVEKVMLHCHCRGRRCINRDREATLDGMGKCDGGALCFTLLLVDLAFLVL